MKTIITATLILLFTLPSMAQKDQRKDGKKPRLEAVEYMNDRAEELGTKIEAEIEVINKEIKEINAELKEDSKKMTEEMKADMRSLKENRRSLRQKIDEIVAAEEADLEEMGKEIDEWTNKVSAESKALLADIKAKMDL